ncbi:MAG: D-glycero-beta-D-manno-heptose-7-phosphate kinase [Fimbriiglobus sp.]
MRELLARFAGCRVLVVGDVMLDEFIVGHVSRISPEAPVPVVEVDRRTLIAGGAANTAANLAALGAEPRLAGLVGGDDHALQLRQLLEGVGVDVESLVVDASRPTTTKTRIVAGTQQIVRMDQERSHVMASDIEMSLLGQVQECLAEVRACVISDYGKGVITPSFVQEVIRRANAAGVPTVVDPKGVDYAKYRGATVVKPNQLEAGKVLNRDLKTSADVDRAGADLLAQLGPKTSILITRGPHGMSLFEPGNKTFHIPTLAREVYDVTGAGDTVAGTMTLTLAVGGNLEQACQLATHAAAIVVGKVGTATCSLAELQAALGEEG